MVVSKYIHNVTDYAINFNLFSQLILFHFESLENVNDDVLKFLQSIGMKIGKSISRMDLSRIKLLLDINEQFDSRRMNLIAKGGNLEVLKYLYNLGYKCDSHGLLLAMLSGNVEVVNFLYYDKGLQTIGKHVVINLMNMGKYEMVMYIIKHFQASVDLKSVYIAIDHGEVDMVRFFLEIGIKLNTILI
eukprot:Pgem_evm5s7246